MSYFYGMAVWLGGMWVAGLVSGITLHYVWSRRATAPEKTRGGN